MHLYGYDGVQIRELVSQKCTQEIHPKTALIGLDQGANTGLLSQKCIPKISLGIHPKINWSRHQQITSQMTYWAQLP